MTTLEESLWAGGLLLVTPGLVPGYGRVSFATFALRRITAEEYRAYLVEGNFEQESHGSHLADRIQVRNSYSLQLLDQLSSARIRILALHNATTWSSRISSL